MCVVVDFSDFPSAFSDGVRFGLVGDCQMIPLNQLICLNTLIPSGTYQVALYFNLNESLNC